MRSARTVDVFTRFLSHLSGDNAMLSLTAKADYVGVQQVVRCVFHIYFRV